MTWFVCYVDDDDTGETIVREFKDRESMLSFCRHCKKCKIEIVCVWSEGGSQ